MPDPADVDVSSAGVAEGFTTRAQSRAPCISQRCSGEPAARCRPGGSTDEGNANAEDVTVANEQPIDQTAGQGTVGIAVDFSSEQGKLVRVAVHGVRAGAAGQKIAVAPQHADIGP